MSDIMPGEEVRRIRHKAQGWTGTLQVITDDFQSTGEGSHHYCFKVSKLYLLSQDGKKPDGTYVEDPRIESLDELEFIDGTVSYHVGGANCDCLSCCR